MEKDQVPGGRYWEPGWEEVTEQETENMPENQDIPEDEDLLFT